MSRFSQRLKIWWRCGLDALADVQTVKSFLPGIWGWATSLLLSVLTGAVGFVTQAPPVLWIPGALATLIAALILIILIKRFWPEPASSPVRFEGSPASEVRPSVIPAVSSGTASGKSMASVPTAHDFDLVLLQDNPVRARATRTEDGIDLAIYVTIRNRSRSSLWVDVVGRFVMTFDGRECENPSGGITRPMNPESSHASVLGGLRVYGDIAGKTGNGRISYLFGKTEDDARWVMDVDIDFRILADPTHSNREESVPIEIIADRSAYRRKPDTDQ